MVITILVLILPIVRSSQPNRIAHEGSTSLAIKQAIQDYTNVIPPGISNFTQLTHKSKIFLDNTLICKVLLENRRKYAKVLIHSPSRWGKTTILTMLKSFLEIQVDELGNRLPKQSTTNHKLFKHGEILHEDGTLEQLQTPLLIADHNHTMNQFQGEYPVIYITFRNAIGANYAEIMSNMSLAVHQAYQQHDYMIEVLDEPDLKNFKNSLIPTLEHSKLKIDALWTKLTELNKHLRKHFGKRSYLLIDDYDTPLHTFLRFYSSENDKQDTHYQDITYLATQLATSESFEGIILMSTFSFKFYELETFRKEYITDNYYLEEGYDDRTVYSKLREYFGFKELQIQFLFREHNITGQLGRQAKQWYNGYQTDSSKYNFYNPASVVLFLFHKKIACYRPTKYNSFMQTLFIEKSQIRRKVLWLLGIQQYQDPDPFVFGSMKLWFIKRNRRHFYNSRQLSSFGVVFNVIMLTEDYLIKKSQTDKPMLANAEVAYLMSTWLINHYTRQHHIDLKLLDTAANAFLNFIKTNHTVQPLQECLQQLYKNTVFNDTKYEYDENSAHAILNCVVLKMQCLSNFESHFYYDGIQTADLVIRHHRTQRLVIVQLCENLSAPKSPYYGVEKCLKNVNLTNTTRKAQNLAINIFANKSIVIVSKEIPNHN